ncbi:MAG: 5-formyltetrahydrofolate cyclo-ligase [Candidatus Margulisiibacteriota bacterium]
MVNALPKKKLREQQINIYNQLDLANQQKHSLQIQFHLKTFLNHQDFNLMGSFYPIKNEPNIWPVLAPYKKQLALPVFVKEECQYQWGPFISPLSINKFNIPEPIRTFKTRPKLDICLVPALGVDPHGNRIGWGYGYFDRLLTEDIPLRIGIIYNAQRIQSHFKPDKWDIPLTHIISEKGLFVT